MKKEVLLPTCINSIGCFIIQPKNAPSLSEAQASQNLDNHDPESNIIAPSFLVQKLKHRKVEEFA